MFEGSGEENSGYAVANVTGGGSIHLWGFRQQVGYDWRRERILDENDRHQ